MDRFNDPTDKRTRQKGFEPFGIGTARLFSGGRHAQERGRTAVWQARLVLLVMINIAQLWILSATVEAALAGHYSKLLPLVVSSGVCWLIALTIFLWWKPAPRSRTGSGYLREK